MTIDGCPHLFADLAARVLPERMAQMRAAISEPVHMEILARAGEGQKRVLQRLGRPTDFSGCYVLLNGSPIYVGIGRSVVKRLMQHVKGSTHYDASLAYRIAADRRPHRTRRSIAMANDDFRQEFMLAQQELRAMQVAFIEIANPLELYLFEVYCAMELNTATWNTFRTH